MPAIPDRWIPYKACGNVIDGTRFICFKVPLRKSVQTGIRDIKEIWDIPALLNKVPNLGAVIDLTNTARYYNPAELQAAGVLHKKILIPGRIIPPENKVTEFMNAVDQFLAKDANFLIGFHCTHGLNRTGYMVCRYMRDRLGVPAKDAIKKFEKARGYQLERENYLADLLGTAPPPPDIGRSTEIKPVSDNFAAHRSPLANGDEDNDDSMNRDRYNRYNNRYNNRSHNSRYDKHNDSSNQYNRRDRGRNQVNSRNRENDGRDREDSYRSRSSSSESSRSSYDYRYDY